MRVQILCKEDLPSLNKVISIVHAEEGRRGVILDSSSTQSYVLVSLKASTQNKGPREEKRTLDKDSLWCMYCKKTRHTIKKC